MGTLNDTVKGFIVKRLAAFESPSEVAAAVKEEFDGLEVSRQRVQFYDPTVGKPPAAKWCKLFREAREAFINDIDGIPLAHRSYRLRELQKLLKSATVQRNPVLMKELIVEAEKIQGDLYTNRRKVDLDAKDGLAKFLGVDPAELPEA